MPCFSLFVSGLLAISTPTQNPVLWTFQAVPYQNGYVVQLTARLYPGWHLYSQFQPRGAFALPTKIRFTPSAGQSFFGATGEKGALQRVREALLGSEVNQYTDRIQFSQAVVCNGRSAGPVCGTITYQACTAEKCLPPQTIFFSIPLS